MKTVEQELDLVKKEILLNFIDPFPENNIQDFIQEGSKFIRTKIAILYLKSQNIILNEDMRKVLAVGEIIHNASLFHDDVIDEAITRRNNLTLAKLFNPKLSILAGDYLVSYAIEKLLNINNHKILSIFNDCTKRMAGAEINQYFLRSKVPTKDDYINICKNKTAVLFAAVMESCAILSNLNDFKAKMFGEIFGICFQIKNDLDPISKKQDIENEIYTAEKILGIEKTKALLDNYKEEMRKFLSEIPDNMYKKSLGDLINSL